MVDPSLISRSQAGDIEAFNELVEQYQRLIFNVALRMVCDADVAADVTQDTFLAAYKGIGRFRGGSFKAWLIRIVTNCCNDHFRTLKRSRSVSLDAMLLEITPASMIDESESPVDFASRKEMGRLLNEGLASLPEDQRLVVILFDIQELSYEEIAESVGCSLGTVKSRLNRGRTRLKNFLSERRELLPPEYRLGK